jgi:hypothetical protein
VECINELFFSFFFPLFLHVEFGYPYCVCGRTIVCVKHTTQLKFTSPTIPNMEFSPHFFFHFEKKNLSSF